MGSEAKYAVRTPDEAFDEVRDYPVEPKYRHHGDLRLAYLDAGDPAGSGTRGQLRVEPRRPPQ